jgi:hypothetical protein
MLIACLVLCILFSVAGITAAEVDDKAINEDSNVISEVAAPEVDHSVATEVSEDTNDASQNNLTASVETNDVEDDSIASQSSDVVDTKAASNNVADNKVVGNTVVDNKNAQIVTATNLPATIAGSNVVDNKNAQIVTATNNPEIVGGESPIRTWDTWKVGFYGIKFSNGKAYADVKWYEYKKKWNMYENYIKIDGITVAYYHMLYEGFDANAEIPSYMRLTPGKHTISVSGIPTEGGDFYTKYELVEDFYIYDYATSLAANFNKQTYTYGDTISFKPTAVSNNYRETNPQFISYDVYVDGALKLQNKKFNADLTLTGLNAGTHKISFKTYGSYINEKWFDYYITVNKAGVKVNITDGYFSTDDPSYTVSYNTATSSGTALPGTITLSTGKTVRSTGSGNIQLDRLVSGTYRITATFTPDNQNYNTGTCSFILDVSPGNLRVLSPDTEFGQDVIIKINCSEAGTGYILDVDSGKKIKTFNYTQPHSLMSINLGKMPSGYYKYHVKFDEGMQYERMAFFNVIKATPIYNGTIDVSNTIYLDPNFINTTFINNYNITGIIEYYIDGEKVGVGNLSDTQFDLSQLEVGNHTVGFFYTGDDNYENVSQFFDLVVVPKDIEYEFSYVPTNYPEYAMASFQTNVGYGTYTFTINNKTYNFTARSGVVIIDLGKLEAGNYTVENVTYSDTLNYNLHFEPVTFMIGQSIPELNIEYPDESQFGAPKSIVTTTNFDLFNLTGNVTYTIDELAFNVTAAIGEEVDISFLPAGEYVITVFYNGDDNYQKTSKDVPITITKADVHYIFTPDEIRYTYEGKDYVLNATGFFEWDSETEQFVYNDIVFVNDTFVFNVTMFDQSGNPVTNGTARVYENGRLIGNVTIGEAFEYHAIRGDRQLRFDYDGDDNHNAISKDVMINVYEDEIGIAVDNVLYSQDAIGVISVSKPGTYVIRVGDNTYEVVVNTRLDYPTVNLGILPAKDTAYTAYIQEKGGSRMFSCDFYVYKNNADLTPVADIKGMDDAIITVTSDDYNITGNLEFYKNGELIHKMKFGEVYNISSFDFGHYDLVIKLVDDPNYKDETVYLSFDKKFQASVELSVQDISFGDAEEIIIYHLKMVTICLLLVMKLTKLQSTKVKVS